MGRLFGTDGARGVANKEITCELAMQIGRAAAMVLTENLSHRPRVLIGMDTRASGEMLESAITAGLCSVGADVLLLGVVPTPAVAYLVKAYNYDAGVMISASHNPCEYNGIKIFQSTGYKLPDALENEIEAIILDEAQVPPVRIGGDVGRVTRAATAVEDYVKHLLSTTDTRCDGLKIALDCANGSSSVSAKTVFEALGAQCVVIGDTPDGVNINKDCGSTHMETVAGDHTGKIVDGDQAIAVCAKYMKANGTLKKDTAVVTVMSNMGFFKFCEAEGIHCERTKVGDRYVLENMLENGYSIGGEQSGHIIFLDYATTGDGQLSAIQLLKVLKNTGKTLKVLAEEMEIYPQVLINVRVSKYGRVRFTSDMEVKNAIARAEEELGDTGRVLVRVSGTEPLVRVMLEGKDEQKIQELGESIAEVIRERLV